MRHSSMAREQRAPLGGRRSAWVGIRIHSPNPCGIEVAIVLSTSVDSLISKLHDIQEAGWHKNARTGNDGGVGNTLEDLLGIRENNLAAPDLDGWEIKCQRLTTKSLLTLFHLEPSPTEQRLVPNLLLPLYGWKHRSLEGQNSFRQTINALVRTDRGFGLIVDPTQRRVSVSFDASAVASRHSEWMRGIARGIGLRELDPQPYWDVDQLFVKAATKLHNCIYIKAAVQRLGADEHYRYDSVLVLEGFNKASFVQAIEAGHVRVDFDASTRHNHGTKFRLHSATLPSLYSTARLVGSSAVL